MLRVFDSEREMAEEAARFVAAAGIECVNTRRRFDLVLAGGRTPLLTYSRIVSEFGHIARLWSHAHIWWGDERMVPADNRQSNYYVARMGLLMPLALNEGNVHRIRGEAGDLLAEAEAYSNDFPASPDLLLLGVGEDGHIASLFPGSPLIQETRKRFAPVIDAPKTPPERITITPAGLRCARRTLVLVSGAAKAEAVRRTFAAGGAAADIPARLVKDALWMVDRTAAAEL